MYMKNYIANTLPEVRCFVRGASSERRLVVK